MIEGKQPKSNVKMLDLEDKNSRLVELVQKVIEENKILRKNLISIQESFEVICNYNQKLASLVQSMKDKSTLQEEEHMKAMNVFNFFREFYRVASEEKWQPPNGEAFLAKIFEGLQKFSEAAASKEKGFDIDAKLLFQNRKCFSIFNTI